jgi:hypothetical protein
VFGARQAVHQVLSGNGASVTRETPNVSTSPCRQLDTNVIISCA